MKVKRNSDGKIGKPKDFEIYIKLEKCNGIKNDKEYLYEEYEDVDDEYTILDENQDIIDKIKDKIKELEKCLEDDKMHQSTRMEFNNKIAMYKELLERSE